MKRLFVIISLVIIAGSALAHSGATGIVKVRMDGMKSLGQSMKTLATMAKSGEIDSDVVLAVSRQIQNHSGKSMTELFPEGSLQGVSEAAPEIWDDWDRFTEISDSLFDIAIEMESAVMRSDFELDGWVKRISATCSSCHEDFRIKK